MKNFKSLILGSAAAVFAVAGAQAADLPVKAKPVEYVKVCSAYGAGFYYIPGTDICLRIGGFIYSEFQVNDRAHGGQMTAANRDRLDDWTSWRIRQALVIDARTNTEYGTLRSYFTGGFQWDTNNAGLPGSQAADSGNWTWYYGNAFIQFAGFTFGIANSFFDFDGTKMYNSMPGGMIPKSSPMIAYTAQLGNGVSATVSMEDATMRRNRVLSGATNRYAAQYMPDFVANLRVDQAWGDAQISGAIHQVMTTDAGLGPVASEKYGYAFLGGLNFKLPMIGAGDNFQISGVWSKGAVEYNDPDGSNYNAGRASISYRLNGNTAPNLTLFDSYILGGNQHLATSTSVDAEFRHFWTPTLRSSIGYTWFRFDAPGAANGDGLPDGTVQTVMANLIWSPVKNLDLGTEVYWADLKTKNGDPTVNGSESWWGGVFKATRYW